MINPVNRGLLISIPLRLDPIFPVPKPKVRRVIPASSAYSLSLPSRTIIPAVGVLTPELDEPAGADLVAGANKRRDVDIQRRVRLGVRQQDAHGAHALEHAVRGGPGVLEQIETDLAGPQRHVGVHDGRDKNDGWRRQRVRLRDPDPQQPPPGIVARAQAAPVDHGFPG